MEEIKFITEKEPTRVFNFFVFLTLVAYISRIAELFPFLITFRVNLLLFVTTSILFITSGGRRNIRWENNPELKAILLFLFLGCISVPLSVWPGHAFATVKNSLMINTAIFLFCQAAIQNEKQLYGIIKIVVFSCTLLLAGLIFKPTIVEGYRVTTTMTYDPNDIALLFCFAFPLVLSFFISSKLIGKLFTGILLLGLIIGIIKTGSRGGMLAFGVSMMLIIVSKKIHLGIFSKAIVIALTIMFLLSPKADNLRERFNTLISGKDYNITNTQSAAGGRLAIWKSGMKLLASNPLLGIGAGNSATAMGLEHGGSNWKTMHNSFLQAAVEMGILGMCVYIWMLLRIRRNCLDTIQTHSKEGLEGGPIHIISLATGLYISIIAYVVAALFLSQAFSLIIPLALAISSRLKMLPISTQTT